MYYRGLIHHIKENKTDLTERCEFYGEALDAISKSIIEHNWIASDCEFSVLSDEGSGLKQADKTGIWTEISGQN